MNFRERVTASGLAKEEEVLGLSPQTIAEIETACEVALPPAYRAFLAECGGAAGSLSPDAALFYPTILELKRLLVEMLVDVQVEWRPSAGVFVFAAYQGFQFRYFVCGESGDPPVYLVMYDDEGPKLEANSFSQWFEGFVASCEAAIEKST